MQRKCRNFRSSKKENVEIFGRAFSLFFHVFWLMFEYKRPHFGDFIHKTIISKWNGKVYFIGHNKLVKAIIAEHPRLLLQNGITVRIKT